MENQVRQLKLNVTNIKSYLFNSNKELRKLQVKKNNLFSKLQKQEEFRKEEKRIETKNVKSGLGRIAGAVVAPARSFFDRLLDFFGLIALGILANKLPEIIKGITDIAQRIENFFNSDFMKNLTSILETVGTAFTNLGRFIGLLPEDKQNEYEKALRNEIDKKLDEDLNTNMDTSEMELKELEKLLKDLGGDVEKLNKELDEKNNNDNDEEDDNKSQNQWWDFLDVFPNQQPEATAPEPQQSTTNPELPSQQQTSPEPTPEPDKPKPPQRLSRGGTVRSDGENQESTQVYQPRKGGRLKRAQRSANEGFAGFPLAVDSINDAIEKDEENMMAFVEMSKKFRELSILKKKSKKDKKLTSPDAGTPGSPRSPGSPGASGYDPGKTGSFPSGAWIGRPGDPDGEQTGLNMNLPGGIGTPIYAPFDMIYRAKGTDGNPSVGLQGTASALGPAGNGFGFYGSYRYMKNGKEYEVLMGHFRDLPYKGANDGDIIKKGTLLGYQGASGRSVSSSNGVYPHISLHVNGVGFQASNSELVDVANSIKGAKPSKSSSTAKKEDEEKNGKKPPIQLRTENSPVPRSISVEEYRELYGSNEETKTGIKKYRGQEYYKQNGKYYEKLQNGKIEEIDKRLYDMVPSLSSSISPKDLSLKNNQLIATASGAPQSLFVYAIQPQETFVPFPYPMPTPQESGVQSPEPSKLSSIWRA